MDGEDKVLSIFVTALFLGAIGSMTIGWPAAVSAGAAIAAIAMSKRR